MTSLRPAPALLIAASLCAGMPGLARGQLADSSPFAPVVSSQGPGGAQSDSDNLELRGILGLSSGSVFCIYDVNRKTGTWAKLGVRTDNLLVRSFDPEHESVVVEASGRVVHLVLKESKVESDRGFAGMPGGGRPQPAYGLPSAADQAARLQMVAQDIQRRRMLRQQAVQMAPGPRPQQ